jgi:NAD(P)-dependent dehydrogenase (short-subunit alcohol dehydrogenase family)
MREVRSLAYDVRETTPRLDGLILNAAEARSDIVLTEEGIETNFATNHLSGFLLMHLLLPLLQSSAPARVVVISSSVHAQVKMVDLEQRGHWRPTDAGQLPDQQAAEHPVRP